MELCVTSQFYVWQSQAVLVFQRLCGTISFFLYHSFYSVYFPIELNGEMLIGQNESHDYSDTVLAKMHISSCLNANDSHTTLTYRHITKHIWQYKPNSAYFTKNTVCQFVRVVWLPFNHCGRGAVVGANWAKTRDVRIGFSIICHFGCAMYYITQVYECKRCSIALPCTPHAALPMQQPSQVSQFTLLNYEIKLL